MNLKGLVKPRQRTLNVEPIRTCLPLELWIVIASYFPAESLHKLLGINRPLFNWVMDRLYERVEFSVAVIGVKRPNIQQLRYNSIAKRVKSLHIAFCHFYSPYAWRTDSLKDRVVRKIAGRKDVWTIAKTAPPSEIDGSLFTQVTTFTLCINSRVYLRHVIPFVSAFWYANFRGLRVLSFHFRMKDIHALMKPLLQTPVILPNLVDFTFQANHDGKHRDPAIFSQHEITEASSWLTSFLLSIRPSVEILNLILPPNIDTTRLFSEMAKAPFYRLKRFLFSQACGTDSFPKEHSFSDFLVEQCKHSLDHLIIEPFLFTSWIGSNPVKQSEAYHDWLTKELPGLELPGLRTLQACLVMWPELSKETLFPRNGDPFFLSNHSNHLDSVFFLAQSIDVRQLALVTSAFAPESSVLQYLNLMVEVLTPECFDLLANDLPRLKRLDLYCNCLGIQALDGVGIRELQLIGDDRESGNPTDSLLFTTQMERRLYNNWALRRLQIDISNSGKCEWHRAVIDALSNSIPSAIIIDRHSTLKYFYPDFNLETSVIH
ncbi:hypothetical protein V5O48_005972 [Marasmius crinis-equi]|uniref:F-box domain-containing protein n=1 Tax=Marasmius crinis-equi TaxID=585013 RepID=A0ABR3FKU8_9AGAR